MTNTPVREMTATTINDLRAKYEGKLAGEMSKKERSAMQAAAQAAIIEAAKQAVIRYGEQKHAYFLGMSDAVDANSSTVTEKGEQYFGYAWAWFSFVEDIKAMNHAEFVAWHDAQAEADDKAEAAEIAEIAEIEAEMKERKNKRIRYGKQPAQVNFFSRAVAAR